MSYNKKYLFLLLILLLVFSETVYSSESLININFKGIDLRDALRTIAEYGEVNLIADKSVQGEITINLEEVNFESALKLISESSGLGWKYKNNTFFVAKETRINKLFNENILTKIEIKNRSAEEIKKILNQIYPEIKFSVDLENNNIFLRGNMNKIEKAKSTIILIDKKLQTENKDESLESIEVKSGNLNEAIKAVNLLYPEIRPIILEESNKILIYGNKEEITNIKEIMKNHFRKKYTSNNYKQSLFLNKSVYNQLKKMINKYDKKIVTNYDPKNDIFYLEGEKDRVQILINLIKEIQKKQKDITITENIYLNYISTKSVKNLAKTIFPEISLYSNFPKSLITMKGSENKIDELLEIIKEIDKPNKQIMIEAQILEVSFRKLKEMGVNPGDLSRIKILENKDLNINLEWPELFKLLTDEGNAKVLAAPTLLTIAGKEAQLLIGDKIPMRITKDDKEEIKYIEAGIRLNFLPILNNNQEIILKVNPRVSSLGDTIVGSLPSINTREVDTTVRLKNNETFIIAGLIQEDIIESKKFIPILSEIPILGNIFKSYEKTSRQNEVIIMLKPHIINDYNNGKDNYLKKEGKSRVNIEEYNEWKEKMKKHKIRN